MNEKRLPVYRIPNRSRLLWLLSLQDKTASLGSGVGKLALSIVIPLSGRLPNIPGSLSRSALAVLRYLGKRSALHKV
jgi:hypothetical protein